jgi:type IV pilus assembly protein PilC
MALSDSITFGMSLPHRSTEPISAAVVRDVARRAEQDMALAVDRLTGKVEPITAIVLSVCVGLLLLAVMLPLVGIMSAL